MSEQEIIDRVEEIRGLCDRIAQDMHRAEADGRMVSIHESRRLDGISQELRRRIAELPPNPLQGIVSPGLRMRTGSVLREVQSTLLGALRSTTEPGMVHDGPMPRATPSRLKAYAAC